MVKGGRFVPEHHNLQSIQLRNPVDQRSLAITLAQGFLNLSKRHHTAGVVAIQGVSAEISNASNSKDRGHDTPEPEPLANIHATPVGSLESHDSIDASEHVPAPTVQALSLPLVL